MQFWVFWTAWPLPDTAYWSLSIQNSYGTCYFCDSSVCWINPQSRNWTQKLMIYSGWPSATGGEGKWIQVDPTIWLKYIQIDKKDTSFWAWYLEIIYVCSFLLCCQLASLTCRGVLDLFHPWKSKGHLLLFKPLVTKTSRPITVPTTDVHICRKGEPNRELWR